MKSFNIFLTIILSLHISSTSFAFPSDNLEDFEEDFVGRRLGFPFNFANIQKRENQIGKSRRNKNQNEKSENSIFRQDNNEKSENSVFRKLSDFLIEKFEIPVVVEAIEKDEQHLPKEDRFLG